MRALPWIIGGGAAAVAAYYWRRDDGASTTRSDDSAGSSTPPERTGDAPASAASSATGKSGAQLAPLPGRWVWPVGVWGDRKPAISDAFSSKRRVPGGQVVPHGGVDIMFRRRPDDPWRAGTPNATPNWVMPDHRAALAASDGVVWSTARTPRGWEVVIDHSPRKLATYYTHLSSVFVTAKQPIKAGTPLGVIGADPLDGEHIMHLHFEIWRGGSGDRFDPQKLIETTWEYVSDPGDLPSALVARNGGHRRVDGTSISNRIRAE